MLQSEIKKMLLVLFCALVIPTSIGAAEAKVSVKNLDDLNHEVIKLDKELEILKKKVAIKKMENELKEASTDRIKPEIEATSVMTQLFPPGYSSPAASLPKPKPIKEPEPSSATSEPVKKKTQPNNEFTSNEISSLPRVQSIYSFGKKRKAVLAFSDESTIDVSEGESFRAGAHRYIVSKIQSSGVSVKKKQRGESLTLRFAAIGKKGDQPAGINNGGSMNPLPFAVPPAPQFLDSTSNKYED